MLPCVFFWRVLFGGEVLLPGAYLAHFAPWKGVLPQQPGVYWNALIWDAMAQYLPWRTFAHRWLAEGVIPLWNPHQFCGTPFVANGQSALFYPLNLLFWLVEPARAFGWAMALHFALAGIFAFAFLRTLGLGRSGALVGGVAFQFCGFFITWAELPTLVNVGVWLPLVLLCVERFFQSRRMAYAVAGGGVLGVAVLAGHPQMAFYLALGAGAYFVFRWACDLRDGAGRRGALRGLAGGAAALGVAGALAAVQILPLLEVLPYTHRAGGAGEGAYQWFLKFAVPWRHLVTLTLPDFFGRPTDGTYWDWPAGNYAELVTYVGVAPLLLAGLALAWWRTSRCPRHVWFFAAGAVVTMVMAVGAVLNAALLRLAPGFGGTGGPGRALYLWAAFVALLAGMGADALVGRARRAERTGALARDGLAAAGVLAALTVALGLAAMASLPAERRPTPGLLFAVAAPSVVVLAVVLAVWCLLVVGAARRAVGGGLLAAGLVAITAGDLFAFGLGYNPTCPPEYVYPETPEIRALRAAGPDSRVVGLRETWPIGSDFPRAALPPNAATCYGLYDVNGYDSIYLQGYKDALAEAVEDDPSPPANGNMVFVNRSTFTLEWGFAAGAVVASEGGVAPTADGTVRATLLQGDTDFSGPPAPLRMISPNAVEVSLDDMRSQEAWLWLRDAWFPGWVARTDGRESGPTQVAGYVFQPSWYPVTVRPGDRRVEFRYEPCAFRFGLFVTLCALGLLAAVGGAVALQGRRR